MSELDSKTVNLMQLFGQEYFFRIPDYQRPFLWDKDNLSDLIDDLRDAPKNEDYFLGTLVLHETDKSVFDVVDGQQRLTALCILLACLRDSESLSDDEKTEIQSMLVQPGKSLAKIPARNRLQVKDTQAFNKIVGTVGGTVADSAELDQHIGNGEQRYRDAVLIFMGRVADLSADGVRELASFVIRRCVVIYLAAKSFSDAFRLFTVVNDRGKQLRRIDILKAQNLAPDIIANDDVRAQYAAKWESLEEQISEASFEDLFSSLRLIYVQDKPQNDLLKEFNDRVFGKAGKPTKGTVFIDTLESYVALYDQLFIGRTFMSTTKDAARFKSLITAMVAEFRASEWRACVLQYAKKFGRSGMTEFLLRLEKLYLQHWVGGVRKDERYSAYTDILKTLDVVTTGPAVARKITADLEVIRDGCRVRNFYGAGYSKYLLLRAEILASELSEAREFTVRSVEHVLPQHPRAGGGWATAFPEPLLTEVVNTAGNLVLLSKAKNSSAQNKEFAEKKNTYLKPRVSDFPRSMEVLKAPKWTKQVIERRTEEFAKTVLRDP